MNKLTSSKTLKILLIILAVIVIASVSVYVIARPYCKSDISYKEVTIASGSDTSEVAKTLVDNGIIGSQGKFKFISTILLFNNKYKPGTYSLSPSMSMISIARTIIDGINVDGGFSLPAGYSIEQTAEALAQAGFVDKDKFINLCNNIDTSQFSFLNGASSVEGFLMPGTYTMEKAASEEMILITLLNQFDQLYTSEMKAKADALGLTTYQVVSLASYLEKQTNNDKEKADISSVIHNRIKSGMSLDGYAGVPTCSPSIESIKAILDPSQTDYLYFVFDEALNGTHKFTNSAEEYAVLLDNYNKAYAKKQSEKDN